MRSPKPAFLYTSGRANRCNPAGVNALYFSESEATALKEYQRGTAGTGLAEAPKLTFTAEVDLERILDLSLPEVLAALELAAADLSLDWRGVDSPTKLQVLGRAISEQQSVSAIRYPSAVSAGMRPRAWNVALFPFAIAAPNRLRILGEGGEFLEELP